MGCSVDIYLFRQILVLIGALLQTFSAGVMFAFPAVLNLDILSPNNTDITATTNQASWIASINGFTGCIGYLILPPIFQNYGRKAAHIAMNIVMFVGWIVLSLANNVTSLLFARAVQGIAVGGVFIAAVTLSEYSSPSRRGYFMTVKKVFMGTGSLACHSLAFLLTWRQISAMCVIPVTLSALSVIYWPESPAYLAMKGRFEECERSFLWLNGDSLEAKKELKELITAQMERLEKIKGVEREHSFYTYLEKLKDRNMLKSCFIVTLIILCIDASGRHFLLAYIPTILFEITGSQGTAMYCSVVSDLLLVSALMMSCFIIMLCKRRTVLFGLGSIAVGLMFLIGLVVVLKSKYNMFANFTWLIPSLILLHSFLVHVGLIPVAFAISGEVFPLDQRGLCSCISGMAFTMFYAATLKFTPLFIEVTGVSGTYTIFASIVTISLSVLFLILPETKDRTLQDIENDIKGVERSKEGKRLMQQNNDYIL